MKIGVFGLGLSFRAADREGLEPSWRGVPSLVRRIGLSRVLAAGLSLAVALVGSPAHAQANLPGPITSARSVLTATAVGTIAFVGLPTIVSEIATTEYMQAGEKGPEHGRFVGKATPPRITLQRAITTPNDAMFRWHQLSRQGLPTAYKNAVLEIFGADGKPLGRYILVNAWPSKYALDAYSAGATSAWVETVVLSCDEITH